MQNDVKKEFQNLNKRFDEMFEAIGNYSDTVNDRFERIEGHILNLPTKDYMDRKFGAFAKANNLMVREEETEYKPKRRRK